ncbi:MAG: CHAD domain-containing protein [Spirochaetaceae bacterium]|nr:CHAD domain-containing protein [Spirochaetaceae bacterium]
MDSSRADGFLERPVVETVAALVDRCLSQAERAVRQVGRPGNPEALHDFRVALRRCRGVLRAYRPWLGKAAGKRVRAELRRLMRQTNRGRDAEVQIVWLEGTREALRRSERAGLNHLLERLRRRRHAGHAAAAAAVRTRFERLDVELRARLEQAAPVPLTYGRAFGERLQQYAADTGARLAAISEAAHGDQLHDARLAAKRLRYLVEPAVDGITDGAAMSEVLKRLQDVLGELNDARVLAAAVDRALVRVSAEQTARLRRLALSGTEEELARARRRDERLGLLRIMRLLEGRRQDLLAALRGDQLAAARDACASLARDGAALREGARADLAGT